MARRRRSRVPVQPPAVHFAIHRYFSAGSGGGSGVILLGEFAEGAARRDSFTNGEARARPALAESGDRKGGSRQGGAILVHRGKVLAAAVVAVALVAALYLANRYWIAPVVTHHAQASATADPDHPLAPDFSLGDLSGQKLRLADYRGKVVLLDFWATWCGPCRIEIPGFVELQNRYRDKGFTIIGISMDDGPEPVKEFYREFKMNYPVALGDEKVSELYGGIIGLPTSLLIGRDGRIYAKPPKATRKLMASSSRAASRLRIRSRWPRRKR
ncbi:MAG: hypothetical protein DMG26_21355 [Acidobacteria bacterium]|nr:MAG: hypothetical protein DMG26_21355 [Acidobacteriota bacterium]